MSFRFVMVVVVGTGMLLARQGLTGAVEESSGGGGGPGGAGAATINLMQPAAAPRGGAKRITLAPSAPQEPTVLERFGWDHPQVRAAFAMVGINIGPDPRKGGDLDALRARQRDALGELSMEDIGIEGFAEEIEKGLDMADEFGQARRFDAYDPKRNGLGGGGLQGLDIDR